MNFLKFQIRVFHIKVVKTKCNLVNIYNFSLLKFFLIENSPARGRGVN